MDATMVQETKMGVLDALNAYSVEVKNGKVESNISMVKKAMLATRDTILNTVYAGTKDDQLAMIRSDRATVNKIKDRISKEKTHVKAQLLEPYADFETEANEVIETAEEVYDDLNRKAGAIEDERRAEKRVKLRAMYDELSAPLCDYADTFYGIIYKSKWENVSESLSKIKKEMQASIENYTAGCSTISLMPCDPDVKEAAMTMYRKNLDVAAAMQYIASETAKKAAEETRIEAERERMETVYRAKLDEERERAIEEARRETEAAAQEKYVAMEAEMTAKLNAQRMQLCADQSKNKLQTEMIPMVAGTMRVPAFLEKGKSVEASDKRRIAIEFLSGDDWKQVKEFCDLNNIFYSEK